MTERIITDSNGRKHITNEPQLHPPQRTWVNATTWRGLTDEQKVALCKQFPDHLTFNAIHAIESKLKEKNTNA